jgi:IS30 family transposase
MSYKHLTTYERGRIEALNNIGYSSRRIGEELGRHHTTIARELQRNEGTPYRAELAQQNYEQRRKLSKPKGKYNEELAIVIEEKLFATWSPEQIANTITKGKISFKTIYNWIYQGKLLNGDLQTLRQKGKRRKPAEKRGKFAVGTPISKRPKEVKSRDTFGHWELDTMVSSRGKSKGCLSTFVERKSRLYTAFKMLDRTSGSMEKAITRLFNVLPSGAFKTATTDRGKEFACYQSIQDKLNLTLYFADPYSSWQRGSNENSNGLLREFYPKKTDFTTVDEKELMHNLFLINSRPRKCLDWKSPIQVFLHEVLHLT